jgi:hypothetical protein
MKRIAILQSNYIPWKGYFDLINSVDEFVIYDDAQYTKRDWRNRNLIKTKVGPKWLTIPVLVKNKFKQSIKETKVTDNRWTTKHLKIIKYNYSGAESYNDMIDWIHRIYRQCENEAFLSDINLLLIKEITGFLGISTKISFSSDYIPEGNRSEKILSICLQAGATEYLSGPAAKSYLDLAAFDKEGINIKWMDYSGYIEYPQSYPPFIHEVSILDVFLHMGSNSVNYLNSFQGGMLQQSIPFTLEKN